MLELRFREPKCFAEVLTASKLELRIQCPECLILKPVLLLGRDFHCGRDGKMGWDAGNHASCFRQAPLCPGSCLLAQISECFSMVRKSIRGFAFLNSGSMMIFLLRERLFLATPEARTSICLCSALTPFGSQTSKGILCLEGVNPFKKAQNVQSEVSRGSARKDREPFLDCGQCLARNSSVTVAERDSDQGDGDICVKTQRM